MFSTTLNGVYISYTSFIAAHGKPPRGHGHWAFHIGRDTHSLDNVFWHQGSFSEAKRAAVREAKRRGEYSITVGS